MPGSLLCNYQEGQAIKSCILPALVNKNQKKKIVATGSIPLVDFSSMVGSLNEWIMNEWMSEYEMNGWI